MRRLPIALLLAALLASGLPLHARQDDCKDVYDAEIDIAHAEYTACRASWWTWIGHLWGSGGSCDREFEAARVEARRALYDCRYGLLR